MTALPSFASIAERVEYLRTQPVVEYVDIELDEDAAAAVHAEAIALACTPDEFVRALLHIFMERHEGAAAYL